MCGPDTVRPIARYKRESVRVRIPLFCYGISHTLLCRNRVFPNRMDKNKTPRATDGGHKDDAAPH